MNMKINLLSILWQDMSALPLLYVAMYSRSGSRRCSTYTSVKSPCLPCLPFSYLQPRNEFRQRQLNMFILLLVLLRVFYMFWCPRPGIKVFSTMLLLLHWNYMCNVECNCIELKDELRQNTCTCITYDGNVFCCRNPSFHWMPWRLHWLQKRVIQVSFTW